MDRKIRCTKCNKVLAEIKEGKFKITGRTDLEEDSEGKRIKCIICKTLNKI